MTFVILRITDLIDYKMRTFYKRKQTYFGKLVYSFFNFLIRYFHTFVKTLVIQKCNALIGRVFEVECIIRHSYRRYTEHLQNTEKKYNLKYLFFTKFKEK